LPASIKARRLRIKPLIRHGCASALREKFWHGLFVCGIVAALEKLKTGLRRRAMFFRCPYCKELNNPLRVM